ncbi:9334_t:CDS:2, partial [Diversispora eburnea]
LETRLAILEQGKEEKSISTEDVLHSPVKSNDTLKQIVLQCGDTPAVLQNKDAPTSDVSNNVSNSDEYQSQVSDLSLTIPPICVKFKSSEDKRIDNFLNEKRNEQIRNEIKERNREKKLLQSNEASASQVQNSYSDSSPKSHDELHVKQISESQSIPNTPNLPEESSEQNTDLQKTKIPEIVIQPLIEELRIEPLVEDIVKVNVDKNSTDKLSLAIELVHLFEKISLAENNTKRAKVKEITSWYQYRKHFEKRLDDILSENQRNDKRAYDLANKICLSLYRAYTEETGLNPWIKSETPESPQIEKTNNHLSQDCIIKISKFPEEKGIIHDALHKHFPFLSYTKSNAWYRDIFKYTNSEAKCPICDEVHTCLGMWSDWSCLSTNDHYFLNCPFRIDQKKVIIAIQSLPKSVLNKSRETEPRSPTHPNKNCFYQYAIEYGIDLKKFSVITEAKKKRWSIGCFRDDLERDI